MSAAYVQPAKMAFRSFRRHYMPPFDVILEGARFPMRHFSDAALLSVFVQAVCEDIGHKRMKNVGTFRGAPRIRRRNHSKQFGGKKNVLMSRRQKQMNA